MDTKMDPVNFPFILISTKTLEYLGVKEELRWPILRHYFDSIGYEDVAPDLITHVAVVIAQVGEPVHRATTTERKRLWTNRGNWPRLFSEVFSGDFIGNREVREVLGRAISFPEARWMAYQVVKNRWEVLLGFRKSLGIIDDISSLV